MPVRTHEEYPGSDVVSTSPDLDGSGAWTEGGGVPDLRYMPAASHES